MDISEIMSRLDDIEAKIDKLIEIKQNKEYTIDYYSSHWDDESGKRAEVFRRGDGEWGVEYYIKDAHDKTEIYEGKSEAYAESAAENYVIGIKNV